MSVDHDAAGDAAPSADVDVPRGRAAEHYDPDEFEVRCTSCGLLERFERRPPAEARRNAHGLDCAPTAVRPVRLLEPRDPEPGDELSVAYRSKQSGNTIRLSGVVLDVEDGVLAFRDPCRERRVYVDPEAERCRSETEGHAHRIDLGALLELEVRAGDGEPDPADEEPDGEDLSERERLAIEEFEARVAAATAVDALDDDLGGGSA